MIAADMRYYDYFTLGAVNDYGQEVLPSADDVPEGKVKMAIYTSSITVQDNINFKDANFIGLTKMEIDDSYIIKYGEDKLKVLTVIPAGRFKQVFLKLL
jgi:hypothetical protein